MNRFNCFLKTNVPFNESICNKQLLRFNFRTLLVAFCLLYQFTICYNTSAQAVRPFKLTGLYAGIGPCFAFGQPGEAGLSLSFILGNKWGASLSSKYFVLNARNMPNDYIRGGGYTLFFLLPIPLNPLPTDNLGLSSFMLSREFNFRFPRIRFGLEAGPSRASYTEAHFTKKPVYIQYEDNYFVEYINKHTTGLTMRAKVEFPVGRFVGFEFALVGNVNKYRSFIGWDAFFNFGFVREKIRPAIQDASVISPR